MATLKVGEMAPDFTAETDTGETLRLSDLRGKKVILYFYPRDDTPGCTTQACGFRDSYTEIEAKGAVVLGVSKDSKRSHERFKAKYDLPFPLLIDADHQIADAYGVWGERKFMGRAYMGMNRSHFVIDADGKLIGVEYGVKPAESPTKSLAALA